MTKQVYVEKKNLFEKIIKRMIGKQVRNNQFTTKFTKRNETLLTRLSLCDYFYKVGKKQWEKKREVDKSLKWEPCTKKNICFYDMPSIVLKNSQRNITYQ